MTPFHSQEGNIATADMAVLDDVSVSRRKFHKPIVGILGYLVSPEESVRRSLDEREHAVFALNYFEKVASFDMLPVAIPAVSPAIASAYADLVDGLVFTGGADVDPAFYGDEPHPRLRAGIRRRDEFELAIAQAAVAKGLPVLGICRGMQVVNVAMGGSLLQYVGPEEGYLRHGTGSPAAAFHDVEVVDDELKSLLGDRLTVNSLHHQAIRVLANGLRVAATSPDSLIEAALGDDEPILCVQWHPEQLALGTVAGDAPFAWLRSRVLQVEPA
jgi:putative glutamine amidotransferase